MQRWAVVVVGMLLSSILVQVAMVYTAVSSDKGAVAADPYSEGLRHEELLAMERLRIQRGWRVEAKFTAAALEVLIADREGHAVTFDAVEADLHHPASKFRISGAALNKSTPDAPYLLALPHVAQGIWLVSLRVRRGTETGLYRAQLMH